MPACALTRRQMGGMILGAAAAARLRAADESLPLDHFKLRVSNLEKSVEFYYRLFGCPMKEMRGGSFLTPPELPAIFLQIGRGRTYLILSPRDEKTPTGLEHIATNRAGLARVLENGLPLAFPGQPAPGPDYVRDPAGNLVEFVGPTPFDRVRADAPRIAGSLRGRKPAFEPIAIRQVTLGVSDLHRAAGFYRLFGTELSARRDGATFDFSGTTLGLSARPVKSGLAGFTVSVRSLARKTVSFRDPDGNRVELVGE